MDTIEESEMLETALLDLSLNTDLDTLFRPLQERTHTALELIKIEQVRRFLIDNGIADETGFEDYIKEL